MADREVLVVAHTEREAAVVVARHVIGALREAEIGVRVLTEEADALGNVGVLVCDPAEAASGAELVVVFGGDGTILRAAEFARQADIPLLGVNLGRVGFLAEVERHEVGELVGRIAAQRYAVERRMTLDADVLAPSGECERMWALNDLYVTKSEQHHLLDCIVEIQGRPVCRWACDGLIVATPTGSTAYAFSAGGPIMWPDLEAVLVVPVAAHSLFGKPLIVSPTTPVAIEVVSDQRDRPVLWADGRRGARILDGGRVELRAGASPIKLARIDAAPFADRLVAKFDLPVHGWRGMVGA